MHEMAITTSLLQLTQESMEAHNATKLLLVRVRYGELTQLVPEAMEAAFLALTHHNPMFENAVLELVKVPALLECSKCKQTFTPIDKEDIFSPCPHCKVIASHQVLQGRELFLDHIEAE